MKALNGCTRRVYLIGKYAIKIPQFHYEWHHFLLGLLANMQEVTFSKMKDERLCPVLFYIPGGWLIVMPRCIPISRKIFYDLDVTRFWPDENEDYHPANVCERASFNVPVENKQDSFGYYNGKIVAIDYGS
jgi:hypothetical protein